MSGQQQHPGSDQESHQIDFPLIFPSGIVREILCAGLDAWTVRITNRDTGQVRHETYNAPSADDAETYAFNDAQSYDPEGSYEVSATLEYSVRKLWDVVPFDKPEANDTESAGLREPPLIGRVVATDFDAALRKALEVFFDKVIEGIPLFVRLA